MPTEPQAGEVWFAELGMVEKSRPVRRRLELSHKPDDRENPGDADHFREVLIHAHYHS